MYPDFKNYDEYNHYILSYASNQDVAELEKKIDDVQKDQEGQSDIPLVDGKIPASYLPSNMVTTGEDGKITVDKLPESVVTVGDDGTIPSSKLPSYVDDVVDVDTLPETGETGKIYITAENKQYRWTGSQFAEITSGGVVIGDVTGTAYDGGKGVVLEGRVTTIENNLANYPTKEEMDVAVNAIDEKVTTLEGKAVTYSDFSYVPSGESQPVERKTIQLANYDSISGMNTVGNDAANLIMMSKWDKVDIGSPKYPLNLNGSEFTLNDDKVIATVDQIPDVSNFVEYKEFTYGTSLEVRKTIELANYDSISGMNTAGNESANLIMMSKWDKVDIGSSRYPVNLNGSEFTLNDNRDIAKVYETNGLTDLSEGASDNNIRSALGLDFDKLIEIIQDKDVIIVDRTSVGDYKTCIHATGNISGGNGAANLMFFIGITPTIYQVQYVSGTFALAVNKYEFAKKDEIPSLDGYATTQDISDSIAAEAGARDKAIETATSDLVHNTLTVAGKSLTGDITIASTDLTDGTALAQKSEIPTSLPNPNALTINYNGTQAFTYDGSQSETGNFIVNAQTVPMSQDDSTTISAKLTELEGKISTTTNEDYIPKVISCPIDLRVVKDSYTETEILNMFGGATTVGEVKTFASKGIKYLDMSNNIGSYQCYILPVNYFYVTNTEIKLIVIGPDPDNGDLITKFTITLTLNGDASTINIEKKQLE